MSEPYDPNNIFAKILRGEAPCVRVYEDEDSLAFLDIMPRTPGHTLAIPKAPARNLLDIDPDELARFMPAVQRVAAAVKRGLEADGVTVAQFNEAAGDQHVFHLHFHIIPRRAGVAIGPFGGPMVAPAELEPVAARIRAALE